MRFDGSLGNMQIASDFRVVTPLKKKIYDLPFPRTHLIEFFFHKNYPWPMWPRSRKWLGNQAPGTSDSGLCVSFCILAAKPVPEMLTSCKKPSCTLLSHVKQRLLQCSPAKTTVVPVLDYRRSEERRV